MRNSFKTAAAAIAVASVLAAVSSPPRAHAMSEGSPQDLGVARGSQISICNDFAARIYVALAFQDQGRFTAAGWWAVDPNKCEPADFSFAGAALYYAADSDQYRQGSGSTAQDHWGNQTNLYVRSKKFNLDDAQLLRGNTLSEKFSYVQLPEQQEASRVVITFHFVPGQTRINVATR